MKTHKVQFISITFNDGSIGIMQFVLDPRLPKHSRLIGFDPKSGKREASDQAIQDEIDRSAWGDLRPVSWRRIVESDLPQDRSFRAAWRDSGKNLYHDMDHCKELHRQKLRADREPLLAKLDVDYQRADEEEQINPMSSKKRDIAVSKQKLRDITKDPRIEAASSPEELLKITV